MKTAEEWAKGQWCSQRPTCSCEGVCEQTATLISSAQRDAIEAAVYYASIAEAGDIANELRKLLPES